MILFTASLLGCDIPEFDAIADAGQSMGVILFALIGLGWKAITRRVEITRTLRIEGNV